MAHDDRSREVELFKVPAGPYGDSELNELRPRSYHRTMHGLVDRTGFMPFFNDNVTGFTGRKVSQPLEIVDDNGDAIIIILGGENAVTKDAVSKKIDTDGSVSDEETFNKEMRPGYERIATAYHTNGSTTPYVFAAFDDGPAEYRTAAGTWAEVTGTPSTWDGCFSENGNLWVVVNGYQLRKFPAGTNPVSGTANDAIDVGASSANITGIGLLGGSRLLLVKPDGIYVFDSDTQRFENIWAGLVANPHPDTGKGTYTWGNEVYVPLGWGGMVRVTENLRVLPASPIGRDVIPCANTAGLQPVTAMAADASYLYAAVPPYWRRLSDEYGLTVFTTNDDASFNDRTAVSTDGDPATRFTLADLSGGSVNYIYIGADSRFLPYIGIYNSDGNSPPSVAYYNGSWTSITMIDQTYGTLDDGPLVPQNVIRVPSDWVQNEVNNTTKYWLRLSWETVADSGTAIDEVRALPDEAPLPESGDETGADESGQRTHILRGFPVGDGFWWDDIASIPYDVSQGLLLSRVGRRADAGRTFYAFGTQHMATMDFGVAFSPLAKPYADCVNGFPSILRLPADDRIAQEQRAPTVKKGVEYVDLYGRDFDQANDDLYVWYAIDGATPVLMGKAKQLPTRISIPRNAAQRGYQYKIIVGLEDGNKDERPPRITRIVAGVYTLEGPPDKS